MHDQPLIETQTTRGHLRLPRDDKVRQVT
jgi:hypothetical protein